MNPKDLIPLPDAIPVPWGWFQILLILTFILHLLFMNTMLGCGMIALIREFRSDDEPDEINRDISKNLPYTVAFTVNMGVAPLLFLQVLYGHFMYTSSVLMAVYWLSLIGIIIVAYYAAYIYDFKFHALTHGRKIFIAISVLLMLWIAFVFSNNMTLMIRPEKWIRYFSNPFGTLLNLRDPMLLPRYLHFVTASVAVGGLALAIFSRMKSKTGTTEKAVQSGLNWFAGATALQVVTGLWFLLSLPEDKMMLFLGGGALPTLVLACGIAAGIAALVSALKRNIWVTAGCTLTAIVFMVLARDLLRQAFLAPYFSFEALVVVPEYSPMILFLVSFAAGIAAIAYMLKIAASGKEG